MTDHGLVPPHLAVQAMRDNGYRNTAYAIAELMDNSIQASADRVELLCVEREELVRQRSRRRIVRIGVLDNGSGMTPQVLRMALQFGNGTRLGDRSGIGRFGMGLPSASISQCKRVNVWSWTRGLSTSHYTYIDLNEVERQTLTEVPQPVQQPPPQEWLDMAKATGESGTLVVWDDLDRCMWRTATSIIRNSEFAIARMYRKFIEDGDVEIRFSSFLEGRANAADIDKAALPNDPMYLMAPSATPAPFDEAPMFKRDGESWEYSVPVDYAGGRHEVVIRHSYACDEARDKNNAGSTSYGKHAAKNVGVSLLRAHRELQLDESLVLTEQTERWWGVEIDFPPALDELFGVTNNKQAARHFTDLADTVKTILSGAGSGDAYNELKRELEENDDPTLSLLEILQRVDSRLKDVRRRLKVQTQGQRQRRRRHDPNSPEGKATQETSARKAQGFKGVSDDDEQLPVDVRKEGLAKQLVDTGHTPEQADEIATKTIESGLKYLFAEADLEGFSFFTVRPVAGEILIKVNINHPAYSNLMEVLHDEEHIQAEDVETLRTRLERANRGLKLLLMAWARYEDELVGEHRTNAQDVRSEWGKLAYRFLTED